MKYTIDDIEGAIGDIEEQLAGISGLIRAVWDESFPVLNVTQTFNDAEEMNRRCYLLSRLLKLRNIRFEIEKGSPL